MPRQSPLLYTSLFLALLSSSLPASWGAEERESKYIDPGKYALLTIGTAVGAAFAPPVILLFPPPEQKEPGPPPPPLRVSINGGGGPGWSYGAGAEFLQPHWLLRVDARGYHLEGDTFRTLTGRVGGLVNWSKTVQTGLTVGHRSGLNTSAYNAFEVSLPAIFTTSFVRARYEPSYAFASDGMHWQPKIGFELISAGSPLTWGFNFGAREIRHGDGTKLFAEIEISALLL